MLPTLRRIDPLDMFRDFDRALRWSNWPSASGLTGSGGESELATAAYPVDICETDDSLIVEAELPGFTRDQIDVNVEQGVLTISAQRKAEEQKGEQHLKERSCTHIYRRFALPTSVDTDKVDASLADGVLTLKMPKRKEVKPRKIEVK